MYEITYYSLASPNLRADDIAAILKSSREHNAQNNISGCLLFHKNQFIQVLEGEKEKIDALISKIRIDPRHSYFYVLAEGDKEERAFPNWTMAYRELSDDDIRTIDESLFINNFLSFASLASKPTHAIQSFWSHVQRLLTDDYTT